MSPRRRAPSGARRRLDGGRGSGIFRNKSEIWSALMLLRKRCWWKIAVAVPLACTAWGGTFGRVVSIGGQAADIALDEARGVLYVANFTANRIEVMSLADNTIQTSINVAPQPSSIALSPDGHYLVITHY